LKKAGDAFSSSERLHRGLITAMSRIVRLKIFDGFAMEVVENTRRNQDIIAIQWRRQLFPAEVDF
jgi:hypothetical protein